MLTICVRDYYSSCWAWTNSAKCSLAWSLPLKTMRSSSCLDEKAFLAQGTHGSYPWIPGFMKQFGFKVLESLGRMGKLRIKQVEVQYCEQAAAFTNNCDILLKAHYMFCSYLSSTIHSQKKASCFQTKIGACRSWPPAISLLDTLFRRSHGTSPLSLAFST